MRTDATELGYVRRRCSVYFLVGMFIALVFVGACRNGDRIAPRRTFAIRAQVVNAAGEPIQAATFRVYVPGAAARTLDPQEYAIVPTSKPGEYLISGLANAGSYDVVGARSGYQDSERQRVTIDPNDAQPPDVKLALARIPQAIRATVVDASDKPIKDVTFRIIAQGPPKKSLSPPDYSVAWVSEPGRRAYYSITGLTEAGTYELSALHAGYRGSEPQLVTVDPTDVGPLSVEVTLQEESLPSTYGFRVNVVDRSTQKSLSGAIVTLRSAGNRQYPLNEEASGIYARQGLPQGKYSITAELSGYAIGLTDVTIPTSKKTTVSLVKLRPKSSTVPSNVVRVTEPSNVVRVNVVDRSTQKSLSGANVTLKSADNRQYPLNEEAPGTYTRKGLSQGKYSVSAELNGYATGLTDITIPTSKKTTVSLVKLPSEPPSAPSYVVRVNVVDRTTQKSLSGATVTLKSADNRQYPLNEETPGIYTRPGLAQGKYSITAELNGYANVLKDVNVPGSGPVTVALTPTNPSPDLPLVLSLDVVSPFTRTPQLSLSGGVNNSVGPINVKITAVGNVLGQVKIAPADDGAKTLIVNPPAPSSAQTFSTNIDLPAEGHYALNIEASDMRNSPDGRASQTVSVTFDATPPQFVAATSDQAVSGPVDVLEGGPLAYVARDRTTPIVRLDVGGKAVFTAGTEQSVDLQSVSGHLVVGENRIQVVDQAGNAAQLTVNVFPPLRLQLTSALPTPESNETPVRITGVISGGRGSYSLTVNVNGNPTDVDVKNRAFSYELARNVTEQTVVLEARDEHGMSASERLKIPPLPDTSPPVVLYKGKEIGPDDPILVDSATFKEDQKVAVELAVRDDSKIEPARVNNRTLNVQDGKIRVELADLKDGPNEIVVSDEHGNNRSVTIRLASSWPEQAEKLLREWPPKPNTAKKVEEILSDKPRTSLVLYFRSRLNVAKAIWLGMQDPRLNERAIRGLFTDAVLWAEEAMRRGPQEGVPQTWVLRFAYQLGVAYHEESKFLDRLFPSPDEEIKRAQASACRVLENDFSLLARHFPKELEWELKQADRRRRELDCE